MQSFSFSCKARDLRNAMALAKTIDMGRGILRDGLMDMDTWCRFVDDMNAAAKLLNIRFKWGNPEPEGVIL